MKKYIIIAACCLGLVACKKETGFDGPSIQELYSEFTILETFQADRDSVYFATGEDVLFTAKFNKISNWKITIKGETSGAKKVITGQSRNIDVTNGQWNGSTTFFPMFKAEDCIAQLTIDGETDTLQVPIRIKSVKSNPGLVIADFEAGLNPLWTKFIQTGANMDFAVKTDTFAPEQNKYLKMAGTVNWDYLIGLIDYPATAYGTANTYTTLSTNPDDVYFNCLIYGVPNTNESIVLFQFKEDENGDGTINANTDDQYDLQVNVNWVGWKLVSVKYSDLPHLNNGQPATPNGNSQHNPDKLGKISMLHLANPANGYAHTKIDYIVFTSTPLEP